MRALGRACEFTFYDGARHGFAVRTHPGLRGACRTAELRRSEALSRDPSERSGLMPNRAPLAPQIEQFIHDNPQGVLTSFRRNGMPQLSIVTVYPRDGGVGISITENRMKFKNLLRDPRCSVLISHADWWSGFLVFEGKAELTDSGQHGSRGSQAGPPAHLQRHHETAQRGLGRDEPDRGGGQARGDAPAARPRLRLGARPHARGAGEIGPCQAGGQAADGLTRSVGPFDTHRDDGQPGGRGSPRRSSRKSRGGPRPSA